MPLLDTEFPRIAEPSVPLAWPAFWTRELVHAEFERVDRESQESFRGDADWWDLVAWDDWIQIIDPVEDHCRAQGDRDLLDKPVFRHAPIPVQVIVLLGRFDGQIGNGGVGQWLFNYPESALATIDALEAIGLDDLTRHLVCFLLAVIEGPTHDEDGVLVEEKAWLRPLRAQLMERTIKAGYRPSDDVMEAAASVEAGVYGAGRKAFVEAWRAYGLANAAALPRLPASDRPDPLAGIFPAND